MAVRTQIASLSFAAYASGGLSTVSSGEWTNVHDTIQGGNFSVLNGVGAQGATSSKDGIARYNAYSFSDNQYSKATVDNFGFESTNYSTGVAVRISDTSHPNLSYYGLFVSLNSPVGSSRTWRIVKSVTGGADPATLTSGSFTLNLGDTIELEAIGAGPVVLNAYKNGVLLFSFTDTTSVITSGRPGVHGRGSGVYSLQSFEAGNIGQLPIRLYANGQFTCTQLIEKIEPTGIPRFYANSTVELSEFVETSLPGTVEARLHANGRFITTEFVETA